MDDNMFVGDSTACSRRSFLKGVGATAGFTLLAGAGLGAQGCAPQEDGANLAETGHTVVTPRGTYEVYETDMLVCGCGYAGMSAAANAAKSGLNVTVVEKGPFGSGGVAGMNFDFLTTWIYDPNFYQFDSQIGPVLNQEVNLAARRYAEERNGVQPWPAPAKVSSSISKFSTKARCFPSATRTEAITSSPISRQPRYTW